MNRKFYVSAIMIFIVILFVGIGISNACSKKGGSNEDHLNHMAKMWGLKTMLGKDLPDDPTAPLYRSTCTKCHDLPEVKSHDAYMWPHVVDRMDEYIIDRLSAEPTFDIAWNKDINKLIKEYLIKNANTKIAVLPTTPAEGYEKYITECSKCHSAPHPNTHNQHVWLNALHKMQRISTIIFYKEPIPEKDMLLIWQYIKENSDIGSMEH